jgi:hypothetical protein
MLLHVCRTSMANLAYWLVLPTDQSSSTPSKPIRRTPGLCRNTIMRPAQAVMGLRLPPPKTGPGLDRFLQYENELIHYLHRKNGDLKHYIPPKKDDNGNIIETNAQTQWRRRKIRAKASGVQQKEEVKGGRRHTHGGGDKYTLGPSDRAGEKRESRQCGRQVLHASVSALPSLNIAQRATCSTPLYNQQSRRMHCALRACNQREIWDRV